MISKIRHLQNVDGKCETNRGLLVCDFANLNPNGCGLGCQMHFMVWCFISAFHSNRTVVYANYLSSAKSIPDYFLPIENAVCSATQSKTSYEMSNLVFESLLEID